MLPNKLCDIGRWLGCWPLIHKRTPNLPEHKIGMLPQDLKVSLDILQQDSKSRLLMIRGFAQDMCNYQG